MKPIRILKIGKGGQGNRVYSIFGKSCCLSAKSGGRSGGSSNLILEDERLIKCGAMRGRYLINGKRQDGKIKTTGLTKQYIEVRHDEKTNTLTTVQKDNLVIMECTDKVRHDISELKYRKLTPVECERLQTLPDGYTMYSEYDEYVLCNDEQTNRKELICNVNAMDAKKMQSPISSDTYALNITRDLKGLEQQNFQIDQAIKKQNVSIVIEKLGKKEAEQEECVIDIIKTGYDMGILCTQIKSEIQKGQEGTKSELTVKTSIGRFMRITLEEHSPERKLSIMLILIKLITELKICTYVKDKANIHFFIETWKESEGSLLSVELSNLKMASMKLMSNTQRYKMIGNGWTVDVISHILKPILPEVLENVDKDKLFVDLLP